MEAATDLQDTATLNLKFKFNPKLGIDNPALSLADDHDHLDFWGRQRPRFCLLSKEVGGTFGFCLHKELGQTGHIVRKVEPGTSAQRQGLQDGDRILGVNGDIVEHEDYYGVVRRIRASGPRVLLIVLAGNMEEVARAHQTDGARLCPVLDSGVRPRLCHVAKDEGGFGFSITHGKRGLFWLTLSCGGAAERAGIPQGARLLEVNGNSVENFSHSQLSRKLRQSGEKVALLVAGPEVEEQCRHLGLPLAAPLAEGWALPARPRQLHLEKGPKGFGFLLREEKGPNGQLGQFLWEVDPGLPADQAGMRAGDRLVAVAGDSVEGLGHEEAVTRIRAQGCHLSLIVVDPDADSFYSMVRLSPLLFLEDASPQADDPASSQKLPLVTQEEAQASLATDLASPLEVSTSLVPPALPSFCQCLLSPGPNGGYGFQLSWGADKPNIIISQVTPGGSAFQAGLRMGDVILEVNGQSVSRENVLEVMQQLSDAKPPLHLRLAAQGRRGSETCSSLEPGKHDEIEITSINRSICGPHQSNYEQKLQLGLHTGSAPTQQ
ncbi:Na(+)/H(+) exchange regulatory cofactor NHE-RF4 isoform X2 [Phascolarctos cinereus]|uniref:Na(+)/H(+) exchange regulatory cofactor NHE-RF4 isoform X1 n=1 Tax=Phascolarctos cinereus TaxID=38626 RepID=A0A6P5K699_PHACI|nr:Na(+)/H(+) exchange regulatory cofactor NHE-RF4 isoform X1 [Phascolarctos cinereus]